VTAGDVTATDGFSADGVAGEGTAGAGVADSFGMGGSARRASGISSPCHSSVITPASSTVANAAFHGVRLDALRPAAAPAPGHSVCQSFCHGARASRCFACARRSGAASTGFAATARTAAARIAARVSACGSICASGACASA
jgi:hypothetical protein